VREFLRNPIIDAPLLFPEQACLQTLHRNLRSTPFFRGHEGLLAQLRTLLRPGTTAFPSISPIGGSGGLNLPEQNSLDQERLVQAVAQWLEAYPDWVLMLDYAEAVVLVAPNNNVCSRPSSQHKRLCDRHTTPRGDCCDEYLAIQGTLLHCQGA